MDENTRVLMEQELYDEMELTPEMVKSIRCLCRICLGHFMATRAFEIRRVPSLDGVRSANRGMALTTLSCQDKRSCSPLLTIA